MPPFASEGKRKIVKFGDSTFYDTLFRSLPATERNNPLCRKFLLPDQISREIGKSHSERENEKRNPFLSKMEEFHCEDLGAGKKSFLFQYYRMEK
ncbi:hypothetical protein CEXT_78261 [Caerostris extrusa]|uniref:Uncharacterized protein n=1 Tax=Caerostris extrusa TaxID=172846 RepID=A0AAV4QFB9_CAEEX|nr:hypothetical protein CEXT_78261 [Caerostris extrusa]